MKSLVQLLSVVIRLNLLRELLFHFDPQLRLALLRHNLWTWSCSHHAEALPLSLIATSLVFLASGTSWNSKTLSIVFSQSTKSFELRLPWNSGRSNLNWPSHRRSVVFSRLGIGGTWTLGMHNLSSDTNWCKLKLHYKKNDKPLREKLYLKVISLYSIFKISQCLKTESPLCSSRDYISLH